MNAALRPTRTDTALQAEIESTWRGWRLGLADPFFFADTRPDGAIQAEYRAVDKAVYWAAELVRDNDHEPAWNEQVHSRILEAALEARQHKSSMGFRNITKAEISPKDLLPKHSLGGDMQGKMVDYAMFLEHSSEEQRHCNRDALMREAQRGAPSEIAWSVNHTTYAPLR